MEFLDQRCCPQVREKGWKAPKNRKKQPIEIEIAQGTRVSRHGVSMTCSYCGKEGHNKKGCALKKSRVQLEGNVPSASVEPIEEDAPTGQHSGFHYMMKTFMQRNQFLRYLHRHSSFFGITFTT
jgi:hypothetical protein